jgi:fatty-acyl-CoA synthase
LIGGDPNGVAIVFEGADSLPERFTYSELEGRAAAVAANLRKAGVAAGGSVAIRLVNTPESIMCLLGIWRAGATAISLPPLRGTLAVHNAANFQQILRTFGCDHAIGDRLALEPLGLTKGLLDPRGLSEGMGSTEPLAPLPPTALVQFTSGSIGLPKGVVLSRDAVQSNVAAISSTLEWERGRDSMDFWLPLHHDMGLVGGILAPMSAGIVTHVRTPRSFIKDPWAWLEAMYENRTTTTAAPDFAYRLVSKARRETLPADGLSSLRAVLSGGERVQWQTLTDFYTATAPFGLAWEALMPVYGMAEATLAVTFPPLGRGPIRDGDGLVSVGVALPGMEVACAPGPRSPIRIRGDSLLSGYLAPEKFSDPKDEDGWFETSDSGLITDGGLYVYGRTDEVVIVAGRNIYAEDLESLVLTHGDVLRCAAFRYPSDEQRFALAIELQNDSVDALAVAKWARRCISDELNTRPAPVLCLPVGSMQRTSSGKVRRGQCRDELTDGRMHNVALAAVK